MKKLLSSFLALALIINLARDSLATLEAEVSQTVAESSMHNVVLDVQDNHEKNQVSDDLVELDTTVLEQTNDNIAELDNTALEQTNDNIAELDNTALEQTNDNLTEPDNTVLEQTNDNLTEPDHTVEKTALIDKLKNITKSVKNKISENVDKLKTTIKNKLSDKQSSQIESAQKELQLLQELTPKQYCWNYIKNFGKKCIPPLIAAAITLAMIYITKFKAGWQTGYDSGNKKATQEINKRINEGIKEGLKKYKEKSEREGYWEGYRNGQRDYLSEPSYETILENPDKEYLNKCNPKYVKDLPANFTKTLSHKKSNENLDNLWERTSKFFKDHWLISALSIYLFGCWYTY